MKVLMVAVSVLTAPLGLHHHHTRGVHCGNNQACILRVARRDCNAWKDARHCRIMRRWEWRVAVGQHAFRMEEDASYTAPAPPPTSPPTPPPPAAAAGSAPTSFDSCVAFHESSGDPNAVAGPYWGLYQFDSATWAEATAAMGVSWPWGSASPAEQTAVFNFWSARYPGAWPNTIPACGG